MSELGFLGLKDLQDLCSALNLRRRGTPAACPYNRNPENPENPSSYSGAAYLQGLCLSKDYGCDPEILAYTQSL